MRRIFDVRFEGNKVLSDAELQNVILTFSPSWFEWWALNGVNSGLGSPRQYVDPSVQDGDTLRMLAAYRRIGYLDAHVSYRVAEDSASAANWQHAYERYRILDPTGLKNDLPDVSDTVIFRIDEGEGYTLGRFAVEGLEYLAPTLAQRVNKETVLERGAPYTEQSLLLEARRVETILRENGYAFFSSPTDSSKVVIADRVRKTVSINLVYHTGPRVKNGPAVVTYDSAFKNRGTLRPSTVAHSVKLDSGQWFRFTDLANSERSLGRLGVLEAYRIQLDTDAYAGRLDSIPEGTELPVSVFLRMASLRDITPSAYVGSGWVTGIGLAYNDRSLFGGAENASANIQWQPFPSTQVRYSGGGQFTLPYALWDNPLRLSANISSLDAGALYNELTAEGIVGSDIILTDANSRPQITVSPDVSLEYVNRSTTDTTTLSILAEKSKQVNVPFTTNLVVDWTNNPFNPSNGVVTAASVQGATPTISGIIPSKLPSAAYAKGSLQLKFYADMSRDASSVLALRLSGGQIWLTDPSNPEHDIPIERRIYGGGPNSLRAWGTRGILVSNDTARSPLFGGYKTLEANLEWRYAPFQYTVAVTSVQRFVQDLRLGIFADVGNVWDRTAKPTIPTLAATIGTGVRYNTMIGVIRIDFGFKLYDPDPNGGTSDRPISPSAVGQWIWQRQFSSNVWAFQFALGQAF